MLQFHHIKITILRLLLFFLIDRIVLYSDTLSINISKYYYQDALEFLKLFCNARKASRNAVVHSPKTATTAVTLNQITNETPKTLKNVLLKRKKLTDCESTWGCRITQFYHNIVSRNKSYECS